MGARLFLEIRVFSMFDIQKMTWGARSFSRCKGPTSSEDHKGVGAHLVPFFTFYMESQIFSQNPLHCYNSLKQIVRTYQEETQP